MEKGLISSIFAVFIGITVALRMCDSSWIIRGTIGFLRNLHSGHIGDYLTWLILGTTVTVAWLLWQL